MGYDKKNRLITIKYRTNINDMKCKIDHNLPYVWWTWLVALCKEIRANSFAYQCIGPANMRFCVWKYCVCEFVCVKGVRLLYTIDCLERTGRSKSIFNHPDRIRAASCTFPLWLRYQCWPISASGISPLPPVAFSFLRALLPPLEPC